MYTDIYVHHLIHSQQGCSNNCGLVAANQKTGQSFQGFGAFLENGGAEAWMHNRLT